MREFTLGFLTFALLVVGGLIALCCHARKWSRDHQDKAMRNEDNDQHY